MDWTQALRRHATRVSLGAPGAPESAQAEVLSWNYAAGLRDNVLHRHTYFEVCTVGRWGSGAFTLGGTPHPIGPGDTFFARPGEIHRIQNHGPRLMEMFWVSFALAPARPHPPSPSPTPQIAACSLAVRRGDEATPAIWSALAAAWQSEAACPAVIESLARALILSILRAGSDQPQAQPEPPQSAAEDDANAPARLAVRYIHDNLDRRLPISEVASQVHVSPRHLARLLRAFTGASPAGYIEAARIQRARHLLAVERLSVKQAARAVGYADVQHFTRAFSRRVGASPAAFRDGQGRVTASISSEGDLV